MTQHFIRKIAGYGPIRRAVMQLHEPRAVSAIYGAAYTIAAVIGAYSIVWPPQTIDHAAGGVVMTLIATAITLGGVLGMVTVASGAYWVERYAAALMLLGGVGYLGMVLYLHATTDGNRLLQAGAILCAGLFFVVRYYWINQRPTNPRKPRARPRPDK